MKKSPLLITLSTFTTAASAGSLSVSVVDKDGKPVPDAVVVVMPANKSAQPKMPLLRQASINQEKMQFIPAVTLVPVGAAQVKLWQADQLIDVPLQSTTIGAAAAKSTFQLTVVPRRVRAPAATPQTNYF